MGGATRRSGKKKALGQTIWGKRQKNVKQGLALEEASGQTSATVVTRITPRRGKVGIPGEEWQTWSRLIRILPIKKAHTTEVFDRTKGRATII